MLDDAVPLLACPHCAAGLERVERTLACGNGHRYDIARQGYVSLLGAHARTDTGDSAEMVAARVDFLGADHYTPLAAVIAEGVAATDPSAVVEIGAGTGYYLAAALTRTPAAVGVALDSSTRAARRAATTHSALGSVVADAWSGWPLRDAAFDVALSVFAPRNFAEFGRVVRPGGRLIVATPDADHLGELIEPLRMLQVGTDKEARLAASLAGLFDPDGVTGVRFPMELSRTDLHNLVLMGPAARHLDRAGLAATLDRFEDLTTVTAAVTVSCWKRGGDAA